MIFAIMENRDIAVTINDILYPALVTEDGINFKFPYQPGTTSYLDPDNLKNPNDERRLILVTDAIVEYSHQNPVIASLIATTYTFMQVREMGWFPDSEII